MRHAIRLAAVVAVAAVLAWALHLPHGYWVPLTALLILRGEFGATFTRGIQRAVGTMLGAVLASLLAAALDPGPYTLAILVTLLALPTFAFIRAQFAIFSLCITAFIVFMVAFGGAPEFRAAADRLLDTVLGAALTLGGYALWPTWERSLLPASVAEMIEGDRVYVAAVLAAWLRPGPGQAQEVERSRRRARVARTNTETSLQRTLDEPVKPRDGLGAAGAAGVLAGMRRFTDAALALEAYLEDTSPPPPKPAAAFAGQLDAALAELASAARGGGPPSRLPALVEAQAAVSEAAGESSALAEETDRMVSSVDVVAGVLAREDQTGTHRVAGDDLARRPARGLA